MTTQTLEPYTLQITRSLPELLAGRTAESHAAFFLPYLSPGDHVLDCGCGPGTITLGLAEAAFPGQVFGLDLDPTYLDRAQTMAWGMEIVNARFLTANAYELPFRNDRFDAVFSHALLEHVRQPEGVLQELMRVLRPGGIAGICTADWEHFHLAPFSASVDEALTIYRNLLQRNGGNLNSAASLSTWLKEAGFEVLSVSTRFEMEEDPQQIAAYLAFQLEKGGESEAAQALIEWAAEPKATFAQAWCGAIARRREV